MKIFSLNLEPNKNDSSDTGVYNDDVQFEPTLGNSELITLPPQVTPRGATTTATTHDGGGRPPRDRRPVSRLIPCFNTKSYCTTMARNAGHDNEAVHATYGTRAGGDGAT